MKKNKKKKSSGRAKDRDGYDKYCRQEIGCRCRECVASYHGGLYAWKGQEGGK